MGGYILLGVLIGVVTTILIKQSILKRVNKKVEVYKDIIYAIDAPIIIINGQYRVVECHNTHSHTSFSSLGIGSDFRALFAGDDLELVVSTIASSAVSVMCDIELSLHDEQRVSRFQVTMFRSSEDRVICTFRSIDMLLDPCQQPTHGEAILGRILDSFPFPVMLKDVNDDFKYIYWNTQCDLMSGVNHSDALGRTDIDIYGEEFGGRLRAVDVHVSQSGQHYSNTEVFVTDDGVSHDTIVCKDLICSDNSKWILITRWEITDLVKVKNSLSLANKQLNLIFSAGGVMPWMWDVSTDIIHLRGDYFNQQEPDQNKDAQNISRSLEFLIDRIHPDDRPQLVDYVNQFRNKEIEKANFLMRFDRDSLYEKYYNVFAIVETTDSSGKPATIIGSMQDVTGQKSFEKQLIVANRKIKQVNRTNQVILDNTDIGLVYLTPDYVVQWENVSKYCDHLLAKNYKTGTCCYRNVNNRSEPCPGCIMQEAFSQRKSLSKEVTCNGTIIQIVATPVFETSGESSGVVLKIKDITAEKLRESDLLSAKENAEKSDKLKSAFLANMSHEIRTPLNAILGFSELMSVTDNAQEKDDYLKIINTNNDLLLQLINDILDLSKIEANTLEFVYTNVEINDLLIDIERSFIYKEAADTQVQILFEKHEAEHTIFTDRNRLQQVVSNFITNAMKFTESGSIKFGYELRESEIYFYVTDTGAGIPQDKLCEIFKRFTKLDSFKTGTGLGLTICQTIVRKLHGQIGVVSELGEGSTFWFTIPDTQQSVSVTPSHLVDLPAPLHKVTESEPTVREPQNTNNTSKGMDEKQMLLIAEDVIDNYKLYEVILGKTYHLIHAWNGVEAVAMHKEYHPSAILMDIKMPLMDGYQATSAIREIDTQIPIIAVTAFAFAEDKKAILGGGFTDFIAKPIHSRTLKEVLEKLNL